MDARLRNVVEFGCGYETFTIPLAKRISVTVTRFDIDEAMGEDITNLAISWHPAHPKDMNVSLTAELETIIEKKVKSGLYNNASEVVRDALRRAFCQPSSLNLDEDTPELAALIREGVNSRHTPHRKGDVRKMLGRFRQRSRA
jgi:putative addiction module CopG family antidote